MGIITLKEYAIRHNKDRSTVRKLAAHGGFTTAHKIGVEWLIEESEPYPDRRVKSGKYVDWRKKKEPEE